MEFYLILGNTKAMVFIWEGGDLRLNEKGEKNTIHKWWVCFPGKHVILI